MEQSRLFEAAEEQQAPRPRQNEVAGSHACGWRCGIKSSCEPSPSIKCCRKTTKPGWYGISCAKPI